MNQSELAGLIELGESTTVQFKERLPHADSVTHELVAFSNTIGGRLIIGVNDKTGELNGLSFQEVQEYSRLLVNVASQSVFPPILIKTAVTKIEEHRLLLVDVEEGSNKPYKDRNGTIFVKNGADKRKVTSNDEIERLLQSSHSLFADESPVPGTSLADVNANLFEHFFKKKYARSMDEMEVTMQQALENMGLMASGMLTLAGLLLLSDRRQVYRPLFSIQCVSVDSNDITGNSFSDNEAQIDGNMHTVFEKAIGFIDRSMRKIQSGTSFNSPTVWEIPYPVFEELLVNAIVHRDYFIQSTIKVFIYKNRVEIHSPGKLPNSLSIENIKNGVSIARNPVLHSMAQFVLPYKGLGTGISRALSLFPDIDFISEAALNRFRVVIKRPH